MCWILCVRGKDRNKCLFPQRIYMAGDYDAYARCCRSAPSSHAADNLNKECPFGTSSMSVCLFTMGPRRLPAVSLAFDAFLQQFNSAFWQACHFAHYQRKTHVAQEYINLYSHWMTVMNTKESHCTETPFQIQFNVLLKLPSWCKALTLLFDRFHGWVLK